jgi:hypothetical protein
LILIVYLKFFIVTQKRLQMKIMLSKTGVCTWKLSTKLIKQTGKMKKWFIVIITNDKPYIVPSVFNQTGSTYFWFGLTCTKMFQE